MSRVRPTSRVTEERGSSTTTVSPSSPVALPRITSPSGRLPTEMTGLPGIRTTAYRSFVSWSRSMSASTVPAPRSLLSTMLASRAASSSTRSCALLLMVRVSTRTRETPNTAITTSTTDSVD